METNRREFTLAGATILAAAALGSNPGMTATAAVPRTNFDPKSWHQRIKRIVQINFNERDPENFDVEAWANYLASCKAQATFLSVTNIVALYPTKLADLPVSAFLKGRDLFGECVKAARSRGVRIVGRLSIESAHGSLVEKHPDWFRRAKDGTLAPRGDVDYVGAPPGEYAFTCQFTGYYDKFVPALIEEVVSRYDIDAIFSNGWPVTSVPICYCEACKRIGDPTTQAYRDVYLKHAKELWALYDGILASRRPDMLFSGNLGGGFRGGDLDLTDLTQYAAWFTADNQGRGGIGAPGWDASQQTRIAKAIVGERPVLNVTGAYALSGDARWRNVTGNPDELRSRLFQTLAAGGVIQYHWLGFHEGFVEDRRWQPIGQEILAWQAANDRHFHNIRSIANVALLVAQRANRLYKPPAGTDTIEAIDGMYECLAEARIPFDTLLDSDLTPEKLARYDVLILPNVALMSDAQALQIRAFAARGGSILATFETGLYDEDGVARSEFALSSLFGMKKAGAREGFATSGFYVTRVPTPGQPSMQRIEQPDHALLNTFKNTQWIQGSSWRQPITMDGAPILTHIPQYPANPTEAVYPRLPHTDMPTVVARDNGKSRLVYLAEDVEAGYFRTGASDLGDLVINAINWLVGDTSPLQVKGRGLVEIYGWQTEPGYAVHLINYTNPSFRSGGARHVYSVGEQKVRLVLRDSTPIRQATLLRGGKPLIVQQRGNVVEFTVPDLVDYEVVALETLG